MDARFWSFEHLAQLNIIILTTDISPITMHEQNLIHIMFYQVLLNYHESMNGMHVLTVFALVVNLEFEVIIRGFALFTFSAKSHAMVTAAILEGILY